jgi:AraC-like DNA-binding protein
MSSFAVGNGPADGRKHSCSITVSCAFIPLGRRLSGLQFTARGISKGRRIAGYTRVLSFARTKGPGSKRDGMIELPSLLGNVVAFDRDIVLAFVRECQLIAGRLPGLSPHELAVLLRRFALRIPSPSTLIGRAVVQLLAFDVAKRASAAVPGHKSPDAEFTITLGTEETPAVVIRRAIEELASRISRQHGEEDPTPQARRPHRKVEIALEAVGQRYGEHGLRLSSIATQVHLTPSHLDRLLTRHTGHSFVHHLRWARLEAAQRILASTNLSIKEVAAEVGYNSVTHLDRDFRKRLGCPPSEWRRHNTPRLTSPSTSNGSHNHLDRSQDTSIDLKK